MILRKFFFLKAFEPPDSYKKDSYKKETVYQETSEVVYVKFKFDTNICKV